MRRVAKALFGLWLVSVFVTLLPSIAFGESPESLVYLLPDGDERYRPVLDSAGQVTVLADIDSITPPAVSPDGTRVAFSGAIGDESFGRYAIYLISTDGSGLTQLTTASLGEFDPEWAPDGDTLAVIQNQNGGLAADTCCRLVTVDIQTGVVTPLTGSIGASRPSYGGQGSFIVYDTPDGVWTISPAGGSSTLIANNGRDASVSPDETRVAYVLSNGSSMEIRSVPSGGGASTLLYSTSNEIENPSWQAGRIYFLEYSGVGYDGRKAPQLLSVSENGGGQRIDRVFDSNVAGVTLGGGNDEMFFYRDDGLFRYYNVSSDGSLGSPILAGSGYTAGWSSVTSVDLDGDGQDEMFFYRDDGLFRYYNVGSDGSLGSPILAGSGYTAGWSSVTSVDLDGDGQDEMFFYRDDGLFRYYNVGSDGSLGSPILAGSGYTAGWSSVTSVDLDGDGQDEMFFYRDDGSFEYHPIDSTGALGVLILGGSGYTSGWSALTSVNLGPG